MLKQTTVFLHVGHMKKLTALAKSQGIAMAPLLRVVIADYLRRNARQAK